MKKFLIPNKITLQGEDLTQNYAKYEIQPLEKGFGHTLGNALRRTLLSSVPGASVFAYRIKGQLHEFSKIEGVFEPMTLITLNLKELVLKIDHEAFSEEEHVVLTFRSNKEGPVYAKDFECPAGVEIISPDLLIMTLAGDKDIDMEVFAKNGRGFNTFEENKSIKLYKDMIITDSYYLPIKKVAYKVIPMKVTVATELEALELEVTTDGSISPEEALSLAAQILIGHLEYFEHLSDYLVSVFEEEKEEEPEKSLFIYELGLSLRSENCLKKANIITVKDLITYTKTEIKKLKNLGQKSWKEIEDKMHQLNLQFKEEE